MSVYWNVHHNTVFVHHILVPFNLWPISFNLNLRDLVHLCSCPSQDDLPPLPPPPTRAPKLGDIKWRSLSSSKISTIWLQQELFTLQCVPTVLILIYPTHNSHSGSQLQHLLIPPGANTTRTTNTNTARTTNTTCTTNTNTARTTNTTCKHKHTSHHKHNEHEHGLQNKHKHSSHNKYKQNSHKKINTDTNTSRTTQKHLHNTQTDTNTTCYNKQTLFTSILSPLCKHSNYKSDKDILMYEL